jgi:glycerophosphoryl diester phosphodiesterase
MTDSDAIRFPRVIGHRGAAGHAPENTLAGFRKAAELGATWVEFDVALTRDDVPVLLHDETLERTTDGAGKLAEKTYQEISALDAGTWFGDGFAGERIPRLETAITLLDELGLCANVEIKPTKGRARKTGRIVGQTVAENWPKSMRAPVFSSFTTEALAAARDTAPMIPRGFLMHRMRRDWQDQAEALSCISVHCNHRILNAVRARQIRDAGYRLLAYTVNDAKRALQLTDWGVESVFSDFPDRILAI